MLDNKSGTPSPSDFDLEFNEVVPDKAPAGAAPEQDELPEKYRGKSVADIVKMHMNAEKRVSQLGNELGTLRSLADQVLDLKKKDNVQTVQETPRKPVTVDEIFADPDKVLRETVAGSDVAKKAEEANTRVEQIERQLAVREFENRHPSYKDDLGDPAFQDWVASNPARVELFRRADNFDVASADALWQMWSENKELREVREKREQAKRKRDEVLSAGRTVPDASTEAPSRGPVYSRAKLMELQVKAHSGDTAARAKWNDPAFQQELLKAYSEERVK
jgi:hypothetical protein